MKNKVILLISTLLLLSNNLFALEKVGGTGNAFYNAVIYLIICGAFAILIFMIAVFSSALNSVSKTMKQTIENNKNKTTILVLGILFTLSSTTKAADSQHFIDTPLPGDNITFIIIAAALILLMIVSFTMARMAIRLSQSLTGYQESKNTSLSGSWLSRWVDKYNNAVPIEREQDVMLDHSYDGIQELDNSLPPWWLYGFYFSILFAIAYLINFHLGGNGKSSAEEYNEEMKLAEQQQLSKSGSSIAIIDENNVVYKDDPASLDAGAKIYATNCATCHGTKGEGLAGPNLTDAFWLHGGGINNIFKTINNGVPGKAMIKWAGILKPNEIEEVASYVWSLRDHPVKGREPEGEIYKPEEISK